MSGVFYIIEKIKARPRRNESLQVDEVEVEEERAIANKSDRSLTL